MRSCWCGTLMERPEDRRQIGAGSLQVLATKSSFNCADIRRWETHSLHTCVQTGSKFLSPHFPLPLLVPETVAPNENITRRKWHFRERRINKMWFVRVSGFVSAGVNVCGKQKSQGRIRMNGLVSFDCRMLRSGARAESSRCVWGRSRVQLPALARSDSQRRRLCWKERIMNCFCTRYSPCPPLMAIKSSAGRSQREEMRRRFN